MRLFNQNIKTKTIFFDIIKAGNNFTDKQKMTDKPIFKIQKY